MKDFLTDVRREFLLANMDGLFDEKSVQDIRDLASAVGCPRPTGTKKEENWQNIKLILSNQLKPKYNKTLSDVQKATFKKIIADWLDELKFQIASTPTVEQKPKQVDVVPGLSAPLPFDQIADDLLEGWLDIIEKGYGFIRCKGVDVFISGQTIYALNLQKFDVIVGYAKKENNGEKAAKLVQIVTVNGIDIERYKQICSKRFSQLKATYPTQRLRLESQLCDSLALRAIDLVAPLGAGQRGLIVSPPKAGKTTLLKQIAQALTANYHELEVIMLLIDERPEEVTDMEASVPDCTIMSSTFDQEQTNHIRVAERALAKAKSMVENGKHVVILMDSITRLARAYNQVGEASGRTLSGGLDVAALKEPKKFFGAARNTEDRGSLTIIATALVGTGSRMDDVIYEEFKGTGNMEIHLDRGLSERRIFPAIDLEKSGTRREDLLYTKREMAHMWHIRKLLAKDPDNMEKILDLLANTKDNAEFFDFMEKKFAKKDK